MNYNIDIDKDAINMLVDHVSFLKRVSYKAASRLNIEFYEGVQRIIENPYGYTYLDENKTYRKYIFYKRYLIIYLVEKNIIYIDYIVDTRQNYFKTILKS